MDIFTSKDTLENIKKSFNKLGITDAVPENTNIYLKARGNCNSCWGTGKISVEINGKLQDKYCKCVRIKKG